MKLQNLTIIFIIIVLPVILLTTFYISTGLKTIKYQALYDTGLITATQDAIQAFELNSLNNKYSGNAETKRSIIKSSVKMLETSLCNTCNISSYNTDEIEEYIPAIMFGLSDGFYVYAPSFNPTTNKYEHSLKSYVYYSEMLDEENGIVIRYYLDSYVQISGYFKKDMASTTEKEYCSKEGYLINIDKTTIEGGLISPSKITYYETEIDMNDQLAVNYFIDNYKFSKWFNDYLITLDVITDEALEGALTISEFNDPEDPESEFSKHKKELIKSKIEGVLNSTITAYSERTYGQEYKMPKLSEEDWEKIYTDVSVTTFFQGKKIGLTKYNGYCVLNSNNHYETINPNLLYFSTDDDTNESINTTSDYYHDIRCSEIKDMIDITIDIGDKNINTLRGFRIGRFQKIKKQDDAKEYDSTSTEVTTEKTYNKYSKYMYERAELACYSCINGTVGNTSVYDYIAVANSDSHTGNTTNFFIKRSYWTSLARERAKLHDDEAEIPSDISITKVVDGIEEGTYIYDDDGLLTVINGSQVEYTITVKNNAAKTDTINITDDFGSDEGVVPSNGRLKKYNADDDIEEGSIDFKDLKLSDLSIEPKGKIEIIYTANIEDLDGDTYVENTATVYYAEGLLKKGTAKCKILKSNIKIEKSIKDKDNKEITTIEKGGYAFYTITITNNNSLPDKVDIVDVSNNNIEIDTASIGTEGIDTTYSITETGNIKWSEVILSPRESVTIKYRAKINGNIGEKVENTAQVYTGATDRKEARATCKVEKKIKLEGKGGSDFHVYLILDSSSSVSSQIGNIKNAANNFISTVGADKVTIIRFAQMASVVDSMDEYEMILEGISTNYLGGLECAKDVIEDASRENSVNYVVFMSDGGPTNTQTTLYQTGSDKTPTFSLESILNAILKYIGEGLLDTLTAIYGGWIELDWTGVNVNTGQNEYRAHLLLTDGFVEVWNSIADSFLGRLLKIPKIESISMEDNVVAPGVWKKIMGKVDELKKITKQVYTVYFQVGSDNDPEYGIKMMASDYNETAFKSTDGNMLNTHFTEIANDIKSYNIDKTVTSSQGSITIDMYQKISDIQIDGTSVTAPQLELIKSKITGNADGTGTLNLKDVDIATIFNTDKGIKILY